MGADRNPKLAKPEEGTAATPPSAPATPEPINLVLVGLLLSVFVGSAGLALIFGNLVTRLFVLVIILTTLNGLWMGALNVAAGIVGMITAAALAIPTGTALEGWITATFGTTGLLNRVLSVAVCGLLLAIVTSASVSWLLRRALKGKATWRRLDRMLGAGLGIVEGAVLGQFLIWAVFVIEPMAVQILAQPPGGRTTPAMRSVARQFVAVAGAAHESAAGQLGGAVNPLRELKVIGVLSDAPRVLNDPVAREVFLNHPAMQAIQERPAVRRALEILSNDPALAEWKNDPGRADIRLLLNSPRLLKALDEAHLVSELSPIVDQIAEALAAARQHLKVAPADRDEIPDGEKTAEP